MPHVTIDNIYFQIKKPFSSVPFCASVWLDSLLSANFVDAQRDRDCIKHTHLVKFYNQFSRCFTEKSRFGQNHRNTFLHLQHMHLPTSLELSLEANDGIYSQWWRQLHFGCISATEMKKKSEFIIQRGCDCVALTQASFNRSGLYDTHAHTYFCAHTATIYQTFALHPINVYYVMHKIDWTSSLNAFRTSSTWIALFVCDVIVLVQRLRECAHVFNVLTFRSSRFSWIYCRSWHRQAKWAFLCDHGPNVAIQLIFVLDEWWTITTNLIGYRFFHCLADCESLGKDRFSFVINLFAMVEWKLINTS